MSVGWTKLVADRCAYKKDTSAALIFHLTTAGAADTQFKFELQESKQSVELPKPSNKQRIHSPRLDQR